MRSVCRLVVATWSPTRVDAPTEDNTHCARRRMSVPLADRNFPARAIGVLCPVLGATRWGDRSWDSQAHRASKRVRRATGGAPPASPSPCRPDERAALPGSGHGRTSASKGDLDPPGDRVRARERDAVATAGTITRAILRLASNPQSTPSPRPSGRRARSARKSGSRRWREQGAKRH